MKPLVRPGRILALLALLVGGWIAHLYTRFEEHLVVRLRTTGFTLVLNGREMSGEIPLGRVSNLRVRTSETFEQTGGGTVTVRATGRPPQSLSLPDPWRFQPTDAKPPVGDWWTDRGLQPQELGVLPLDLSPPFDVEVQLPARTLHPFRLTFEGERSFEVGLRSGLLNNDLYLSLPDASFNATWPIGGPWARDLRRSAAPLAKGLCLAAVVLLVFTLLSALPGPARSTEWLRPWPRHLILWTLVTGRLAFSLWIASQIFNGLPTFQDDLSYYLRARWLLVGAFDLPAPPAADQLNIPFTTIIQGRLLSPYPINWPILLAFGMALGVPWVVAPICGAISVWAQYRFALPLAGPRVGLLAAVLLASSPFCLVLSGSMMSHAATTMLLVLFALGFTRAWPEGGGPRLLLLLAAGSALGFAFGIRPLTATAIGLPTLLLGLWEWRLRQYSRRAFAGLAVFAGGVFLGMLTAFIDNAVVTGNPFLFAYAYWEPYPSLALRFPAACFWTDKSMAQLPALMTGWGWPWLRGEWWICLPFAFAAVPFLLGRARRHDWFALGLFASVVLAHLTHHAGTIHGFGPRIYIDTLFALFYLVARGFQCLAQPSEAEPAGPWPRRVAALLAIALPLSTLVTIQQRLRSYEGYNEVDRRFLQTFAALAPTRGLFLLRQDALYKWIRAAPLLPIDPVRSPFVFAELREDNTAVIAAYGADRPVYIVEDDRIVPYSEAAAKP